MKRLVGCYILAALLAACGGIPLRSIPRLMQLQTALLEASPAELMLAIQVDARLVPPAGAVPVMHLMIQAREIAHAAALDDLEHLSDDDRVVVEALASRASLDAPPRAVDVERLTRLDAWHAARAALR